MEGSFMTTAIEMHDTESSPKHPAPNRTLLRTAEACRSLLERLIAPAHGWKIRNVPPARIPEMETTPAIVGKFFGKSSTLTTVGACVLPTTMTGSPAEERRAQWCLDK